MAKSFGPLFSSSASGSFGDTLTFSNRKSGQMVRYQRKQKDVITAARTEQRSKFLMAKNWWNQLTEAEKLEWHNAGNLA